MNNRIYTFGKAMHMCRKIPWYVLDLYAPKYVQMIDERNKNIRRTQKRNCKKCGTRSTYNTHKDFYKRKSLKSAHYTLVKKGGTWVKKEIK